MSGQPPAVAPADLIEAAPARSDAAGGRWSQRWAALSDRFNPILVKESRQALKSWQFVGTFMAVLAGCWLWSILGLAWAGPGVAHLAVGRDMFWIYYIILAFPLLVVVPFGAYRSLAGEIEDRTYELLSITTLSAWQIITGKLASAALQMLVYLSGVMPCLAFTYLLRGIDVPTIVIVLVYTVAASLGLSLVGLLLATVATVHYRQVVLTVAVVLGLFGAFVAGFMTVYEVLRDTPPLADPAFGLFNWILISAYASYVVFFVLAAAAQLNFASSNRSTALRLVMLLQFGVLAGWLLWFWVVTRHVSEVLYTFVIVSLIHWYVMGMFLTGEPAELSPRVRRGLPQSLLGRVFLAWLQPGPATGYVLAVASNLAGVLMIALATGLSDIMARWFAGVRAAADVIFRGLGSAPTRTPSDIPLWLGLAGWLYLVIYLGIGKLVLDVVRRHFPVTVVTRPAVHILLLAVGTLVPTIVAMSQSNSGSLTFDLLQTTNVFFALGEIINSGVTGQALHVVFVLSLVAAAVLAATLPGVLRELGQLRLPKPRRVADDDAEIAARSAPPPGPQSPWG